MSCYRNRNTHFNDFCRNFPGHASREVLAVFGSLTTCDPGNIHDTIKVCAATVMPSVEGHDNIICESL